MSDSSNVRTKEHYLIFGIIIQGFAEVEHVFQIGMAFLGKASLSTVIMLTVGLSYAQKRDALLALIRISDLTEGQKQQIRSILGEIHKHNAIRNWIAHSNWIRGARPESIKAMQMKIRGGDLEPLGISEDEQDFTLGDLRSIARDLTAQTNSLRKFYRDAGYVAEDIDVNNPDRNSDTSSSSSAPSAK